MRWKVNFSIACIFNPMLSVMLMGMVTYTTRYQTIAYEESYGRCFIFDNIFTSY